MKGAWFIRLRCFGFFGGVTTASLRSLIILSSGCSERCAGLWWSLEGPKGIQGFCAANPWSTQLQHSESFRGFARPIRGVGNFRIPNPGQEVKGTLLGERISCTGVTILSTTYGSTKHNTSRNHQRRMSHVVVGFGSSEM